jgi:hypothetical protein
MLQKPKEPNPGTQEAKVLAYIRQNGSITGREAFRIVRQSFVGSAIDKLRNLGHPIRTTMEESVSKTTGKTVRYARYSLASADYVRNRQPKSKPRPRPQLDQPVEPRKGTQAAVVLDHLRNYRVITFDEAYMTYGIEQLRSPIRKLRNKGWDINTLYRRARNNGCATSLAAIYTLIN